MECGPAGTCRGAADNTEISSRAYIPTCVHICVCASECDEKAHMYTNTYSEFSPSAKPFNPSQYPSTRFKLQSVMDTQLIRQTH